MLKQLIEQLRRKFIGEASPNLNFEHRCAFREQLSYKGLAYGDEEIVEVHMHSGKIGLYKVTSEVFNPVFDNTGQRNWFFEFVEYKVNAIAQLA